MADRTRRPRRKRWEFSKLILIGVTILTVAVVVFTMYAVVTTGDTSALQVLLPCVFTELATATGFYFSKAKAENKIKLRKKYGPDAVDDIYE